MFEIPKPSQPPFRDREDAGKKIAENFPSDFTPDLILAIPRGGLPVAYEVSLALKAPLDVLVSRKLQIPGNPEAGFGAVTFDGSMVFNEKIIQEAEITPEEIRGAVGYSEREAKRLMWYYRQDMPPLSLKNKMVVLTDDGLASGYTMLAAVFSAKRMKASKVFVIVPCASSDAIELIKTEADSVRTLYESDKALFAVADFYKYWWDLTDKEASKYLRKLQRRAA